MSDSTFGGSTGGSPQTFGASFGGGAAAVPGGNGADVTPAPSAPLAGFGAGLSKFMGNPGYTPPDPNASPLDQTAHTLQEQVQRGNEVGSNFLTQMFHPEEAAKARDFALQKTEQLQQIKAQQQHVADIKSTARNWGLTNPNQFGDAATDTTLANEALRQWKDEGNFNAYKALSGLSPEWKNRADLYMPDAMSKFAQHVDGVRKGIADLDKGAGMNSDTAYKSARDAVIKNNDLGALGIRPADIPATRQEWQARSGPLTAQYNQAQRMINSFRANQDRLNQAAPVTDEKVAGQLEKSYQFGNGETMPGFHAVSLPGYGDVQGVMGPPGSRDTANRGVTWSNASPDQIKTVQEQLRADEVKGAVGKYKMARDFANTANNDKLYKSAAGLALISDELGAIGRDVAEGSKAAGSIGLTRMLEAKYGTIDNARNKLATERNALEAWLDKGGAKNPRLAPPSIEGIKEVANFKRDEAVREVKERIGQPLETAGRYGMLLKNMGLDKELTDDPALRATYDNALKQGNREIDSYPMVAIGDRRVMLPTGSNVPGAKVAPLDHGPDQASVPPAQPAATQASVPPAPSGGSTTPPGTPVPGNPGGGGAPSAPAAPPTGGPLPGRHGLPPGMALNTPEALDAFANREIQLESGFRPGQTTGSYKGLGQWSDSEMQRHGITDPNDLAQNKRALIADAQRRVGILQSKGLEVTPANVYLMHQQGEAGLEAHLRNPDAPAWSNMAPYFKSQAVAKQAIWGNMTPEMRRQFPGGVDTVTSGDFTRLWDQRVNGSLGPSKWNEDTKPGEGNASIYQVAGRRHGLAASGRTAPRAAEQPADLPDVGAAPWTGRTTPAGDHVATPEERANSPVVNNAPAIGSTVGAIGGSMVPVPGATIAGGGAGGAAGQAFKDYMQGRDQDPAKIAKQGALGAVLGVAGPEAAPIVGAAARIAGTAAVDAGATALQGGEPSEILSSAAEGGAYALGGEVLGKFAAAGGAKAFKALSRYTQPALKELYDTAGKLSEARKVLQTEKPKLPGVAGAADTANPKYEAAKKAEEEATAAIKEHGRDPDDMVHSYEQTKAGVSAGEAAVMRGAQSEKSKVSAGYNDLRAQAKDTGVGAPKEQPPLPDGPVSKVNSETNLGGKVPAEYLGDAQHAENLARQSATDWGQKWGHLQEAGTYLINKRMDFLAAGDSTGAKAMDELFKGIRAQQAKAAEYVFGPERGKQIISNLEDLDTRYAKVMNATAGMKYEKMQGILASGNTPQARELEKNFRAFNKGDPGAIRAFNAMKAGAKGDWKSEAALMAPVISSEVAANLHGIPTMGAVSAVVGGYRLYKLMQGFMNAKLLGKAVMFRDFLNQEIKTGAGSMIGSAGQRGAVQSGPDIVNRNFPGLSAAGQGAQ